MLIYYWYKKGKSYYVLVKDFNTFMHNQILHHERKHFSGLLFKKCKTVKFKNYTRKIKSDF